MKKSYKNTTKELKDMAKEIAKIEYKYGKNAEYACDSTKKYYENLRSVIDNTPIPEDNFFFLTDNLYNLWLNKNTDEPVTAKELYEIVFRIIKSVRNIPVDYSSFV